LDIPAIKAILANQRWNIDETSVMKGYDLNDLIVSHVKKRKI